MGFLIDTSIFIDQERGRLDLSSHLAGREKEGSFLSVVTASELLHGVHRAVDPGMRAKRSVFVENLLNRYPLLPVDISTARVHAHLWAVLASAGTPIGSHDLWLGAQCIAHGLTMATRNPKDFRRIPGLKVEVWN